MTSLLDQITPLSRGIIWFPTTESIKNSSYFSEIDYLLNGLLTANLNYSTHFSSKLIIGENFKSPLYVMIIREIKEQEIESFITLIKKDLNTRNDITVIDETHSLLKIKKELKEISSHLKVFSYSDRN